MSASGEIRRLRYLEAMGVPVYVTRRALPGAAVTAKCGLRVTAKVAPLQAGVSAPDTGSTSAAQALRESLRNDAGQQSVETRAADRRSAPAATAQNSQEPATRFRLAAVICGGRLWVEALGEEALASDQVLLITAMGRALTHPQASDEAPAVTEFRWPLHDNVQLGLGAEEAAATLQGFLYRQIEEHACVELICLGESSKALLTSLQLPCARRYTPSTRDMLESPALKRDVWSALLA
ncbi:hypothetical protein R0135_17350 [Congregibacter variabilis]|uniref:Uncharacterized protein n=1 Tax=Congregibacter variabilis TaxID=3081200 RepID=A0ABZ0I3Y1_9GAMM|nr:hypothetical protein R0135_17350 [Congregibacter sp. IMCC43200]